MVLVKRGIGIQGGPKWTSFKNKQQNTIYINKSGLFALILHSKLESECAESIYDVTINDIRKGLLKGNGVKNRLYFDATMSVRDITQKIGMVLIDLRMVLQIVLLIRT